MSPAGGAFVRVDTAMDELVKIGMVVGVAALPWGEVMFAIPLGVALDLHGAAVFFAAVGGNVASVLAVVFGLRRWPWVRGLLLRRSRSHRVARVMAKYGIAGISIQAPIISGGHIAAMGALFLGASMRSVAVWLTISIMSWGAVITLLAIQGKQLVFGLWG